MFEFKIRFNLVEKLIDAGKFEPKTKASGPFEWTGIATTEASARRTIITQRRKQYPECTIAVLDIASSPVVKKFVSRQYRVCWVTRRKVSLAKTVSATTEYGARRMIRDHIRERGDGGRITKVVELGPT